MTGGPAAHPDSLALVMPVFDEEACIAGVVRSWIDTLSAVGMPFEMIVLDDGSRDGTRRALDPFRSDPRVVLVEKENGGHGPTILAGYAMAVGRAAWVFQTDSDDEIRAAHFRALWDRRDGFDALFGTRRGRVQKGDRRLLSAASRATVRFLYGSGVDDPNTPYRLMRSEVLRPLLAGIPPDTFAPNLVISGLLARGGARILNLPVPHDGRRTGSGSLVNRRLWKGAVRAFLQLVRLRPRG